MERVGVGRAPRPQEEIVDEQTDRFHLAILPDSPAATNGTGVSPGAAGSAVSELAADFRPYCADNRRLG